MNGNHMEIAGNLTGDPELRFTASGTAVATLNVGVNERRRNTKTGEWEDGNTTFFRVIVWNQPAEHVAESLTRGMRVMVTGIMRQRSYEDKEGTTRYMWEITAEEVGVSLRYATADVKRVTRSRPTGPDTSDGWAGMDASPERPGRSSQSPAEPASPAATVASDVAPERPAEPATASASPGSGGAAKRAPTIYQRG
jgi:single-strand DNA-binding protein